MQPRALALLLASAPSLLAACGGDAAMAAGGAPAFQRLRLAPLSEEAWPSARPAAELDARRADDFHVQRAEHAWIASEDAPAGELLRLSGDGVLRVELEGPFEPAQVSQVAVSLRLYGWEDVSVLLRRGPLVLRAATQRVRSPGELRTLLFDFPAAPREREPFDSLAVVCAGRMGEVELAAVHLIELPPAARLPDPAGAPALVAIGEESRRAVGLLAARPLETPIEVPAGARLDFSYGLPDEVRGLGEEPRLALTVEAPGHDPIELELGLGAPGTEARWEHASVELGAFAGERALARFELRSADPRAACALGEPSLYAPRADAPTVVLVTSDTHRADHLGAAGAGVDVRTPFLDALAARGLVFTDCVSLTNITTPSHVSLMTGIHPRDNGVLANGAALGEEAPTLAERFREAGFATFAAVSAVHLGARQSGLGQGFDRVASPAEPQRDSSATIAELERWLPDAEGAPLFVWLHLFDAHAPYAAPQPYDALYWPAGRDPRDAALPELPVAQRVQWDETIRDLEYVTAQYRSEVTYLDARLAALFEGSRLERGVVAVTADHGELLVGELDSFDHQLLRPATLFVPLILAWPGAPPGRRVDAPVSLLDLGRTLLDLAGIEASAFPGRNLARPEELAGEEPRFALAARGESASVLLGGWFLELQLATHKRGKSKSVAHEHELALFELSSDPECRHDLIAEELRVARRLREMLVAWLLERDDSRWASVPQALETRALEQLAALGYAGTVEASAPGALIDPDCACERCAPWR